MIYFDLKIITFINIFTIELKPLVLHSAKLGVL